MMIQLGVRGANTVTTNQLGQGVVYTHFHYDNLDGGKQEIYVTDINLSDPAVSIAFPYLNAGRTVSAHAATVPLAAAAVNGQFFNAQGAIDFLKVKGTTIYMSQPAVHDEQAVVDDGLGRTNSIQIALRPGGINSWTNSTVSNILSCGVNLVQSGVEITNYDTNDPYITQKNPRTCVARTTDNHLLLECVDGRSTNSLGMTIPELQDDIFSRGAIQHAFSLDGGGSTEMWARGIGVANVPSDGLERAVADAVVIAAAAPARPAAPVNLVATSVNSNISLSWALSSGAMVYNVKRSTTSNAVYATLLTTTRTTCTDSNLAPGTAYYYVVSASNSVGESSNSTAVSTLTIPAMPSGLTAVPGSGRVTLSWNVSFGATGYNVSRSSVTGGPYTLIAQTSSASFTNTGLTNGIPYYFVVSATNGTGASATSPQVAATPECFDPATPLGLAATGQGSGIVLQWLPVANAQNYTINRALALGGPYFPIATELTRTNYTDGSVVNGTVYFYTVRAFNSCGASANSSVASAPLVFVAPIVSSSNIVLGGWGGAAGQTYYIRSSTNLASPPGQWSFVATNTFGPGGSFGITNATDPAGQQRFFIIQTIQP